jgi:DNA-binding NtrC family response regulator
MRDVGADPTRERGIATREVGGDERASGHLRLLVVTADKVETFRLPPAGAVVLGRDASCDISIDDETISRRHARVVIGDEITIEDLASRNGTRVREAALTVQQPVALAVEELVRLGDVTCVVLRAGELARWHRLWSHEYFEGRLDEECARARQSRAAFSVLRVSAPGVEELALQRIFASALRSYDVVARYGPGEWELLVVDTHGPAAVELSRGLRERLATLDQSARVGLAEFPRDGLDPYSLIAAASFDHGSVSAELPGPAFFGDIIERIAGSEISVLLVGETGVGKEVMAERIQTRSRRRDAPFLRLNCAAMPAGLLENELFGHERGAFTGADSAKPGLLEAASGGTIFLDEVGDLPMALQVKLLRVLEDEYVLRIGGLEPRRVDVRFLAATNRDLEEQVALGEFRADLYFRLNGITLSIPPLRDRLDEVDALASQFVAQVAEAQPCAPPEISAATHAALRAYPWPGNIRELRNAMHRAVILSGGGQIEPQHLALGTSMFVWRQDPPVGLLRDSPAVARAAEPPPHAESVGERMRRGIEEVERRAIIDALVECDDNQTEAARLLGISRRTLVSRITRYGLRRRDAE